MEQVAVWLIAADKGEHTECNQPIIRISTNFPSARWHEYKCAFIMLCTTRCTAWWRMERCWRDLTTAAPEVQTRRLAARTRPWWPRFSRKHLRLVQSHRLPQQSCAKSYILEENAAKCRDQITQWNSCLLKCWIESSVESTQLQLSSACMCRRRQPTMKDRLGFYFLSQTLKQKCTRFNIYTPYIFYLIYLCSV